MRKTSNNQSSNSTNPRAERVPTKLPVNIGDQLGTIQNISTTGVYFEIDEQHKPGSTIKFSIDLETAGGPLTINCVGEIVRSEALNGKFGIAAKILFSDLKTA